MRRNRSFLRINLTSQNQMVSNEDNLTLKIRNFWHEGDRVVCTRVFQKSANRCFFCGLEPIGQDYVLFNCVSEVTVDADFDCVVRLKKTMEDSGSAEKIMFFKKYAEKMDLLNRTHPGAAGFVGFVPNIQIITMLMLNPEDMDYKTVKSVMDFTSKFTTEWECDLWSDAMHIYLERKYYIYDIVKEYEEGDNIEQIIEEEIQRDFEEAMAKDYDDYSDVYDGYSANDDCMPGDDLAPEGLGSDEIDWDCYH